MTRQPMSRHETARFSIDADPYHPNAFVVKMHHALLDGGECVLTWLQPSEIAELHTLLAGWLEEYGKSGEETSE